MNPRSRNRGATALLIASLLLVVATAVEAPFLNDPDRRGALFWAFAVVFGLSSIGYLIAGLLLALGRYATAAGSATARIGLLAFGAIWLVAQALYLWGTYLTPSDGVLSASTVLSLLMLVAGLIAGIAIGAQRLVRGAGRWSLLIGVLVSAVTGVVAGASDSAALITVMHLVSAVGLAVVGASYLLSQPSGRTAADAR